MVAVTGHNKPDRLPRRAGVDGFTLIELLVAISIIALLMAVLVPALSGARKSARLVICKNQMKQIGIAFHTYGVNNQDEIALARDFSEGTDRVTWDDILARDMGHPLTNDEYNERWISAERANPLLICPEDPNPTDSDDEDFAVRTYAMPQGNDDSGLPDGVAIKGGQEPFRFSSDIGSASETLLLLEYPKSPPPRSASRNKGNLQGGLGRITNRSRTDEETVALSRAQYQHDEYTDSSGLLAQSAHTLHGPPGEDRRFFNYLFVDGHVKNYRPIETIGSGQDITTNNPRGMWSRAAND